MPFAACKDIEWTRDGLRDTGLDVTAMPCGVCPDDYDQVVASIHQTGTSWTRWFPRLMKLHATLHACKEQGFLSYETPLCVVKLGLGAHMKTAFAMTTHARLGSRSGGAGLDSLVLNMIFEAAEEDHVDRDEYEKKGQRAALVEDARQRRSVRAQSHPKNGGFRPRALDEFEHGVDLGCVRAPAQDGRQAVHPRIRETRPRKDRHAVLQNVDYGRPPQSTLAIPQTPEGRALKAGPRRAGVCAT